MELLKGYGIYIAGTAVVGAIFFGIIMLSSLVVKIYDWREERKSNKTLV